MLPNTECNLCPLLWPMPKNLINLCSRNKKTIRWKEHRADICPKVTPVAGHIRGNPTKTVTLWKTREKLWIHTLQTYQPLGINLMEWDYNPHSNKTNFNFQKSVQHVYLQTKPKQAYSGQPQHSVPLHEVQQAVQEIVGPQKTPVPKPKNMRCGNPGHNLGHPTREPSAPECPRPWGNCQRICYTLAFAMQ